MRQLVFFIFVICLCSLAWANEEKIYRKAEPIATKGELQASEIAEEAQTITRLKEEAEAKRKERTAKLNAEVARRSRALKEFNSKPQLQRIRLNEKSERLAGLAKQDYDKGLFNKAEGNFRRALSLDPNNESLYFMYGVSLYRVEKLEEALLFLELAETQGPATTEKAYYQGLIHFKLQEYYVSGQKFREVRQANIPVVSPSAAFYEGVIEYTLGRYKIAQAAFEWVLDNSKDPTIDKQADQYLEKIAKAIQLQKLQAKKWKVTASGGLNYDSNILYTPDNDSATAVVENDGGGRVLLQAQVDRKLSRKEFSDWTAKFNTLYMYSFDDDFNRADPWLSSLGAQYGNRGKTMRDKAYQFTTKASGEILYMDADDDGTRDRILDSIVLDNNLTIIQNPMYFAAYGLEVRVDNSELEITDEDDNSDAFKYTLSTTHTLFLNEAKKQAFIGKIKYAANDAKGANKNFNRFTVSATYAAPAKKWQKVNWSLGLTAFKLTYPESDEARRDTNMTLDLSLSKGTEGAWTYTGVASYSSNTSTVEDNQYTRYSLLGLATYSWTD